MRNYVPGWHLGFGFELFKKLQTQTLITYTKHYGAYSTNRNLFTPPRSQWYVGHSIHYDHNPNLQFIVELAKDWGILNNSTSMRIGLVYEINGKKRGYINSATSNS